MAPCSLLIDCLIDLVFDPEDGGITFLRNVCELLWNHIRRHIPEGNTVQRSRYFEKYFAVGDVIYWGMNKISNTNTFSINGGGSEPATLSLIQSYCNKCVIFAVYEVWSKCLRIRYFMYLLFLDAENILTRCVCRHIFLCVGRFKFWTNEKFSQNLVRIT